MPHLAIITRRTAIGGALTGVLSGAGCSLGADEPAPSDTSSTITPTQPAVDADAELVNEVLLHIANAHHVVRESLRQHRNLRPALKPFEVLHRTHARELGDLPAAESTRTEVSVTVVEVRLQRRLTQAASQAESGALALLLASMAAAVAQQRAAL